MMTNRTLRLALSMIVLLGGAAVLVLVLTTGRPGPPAATPPSPSPELVLTPPTEPTELTWQEGVSGPASSRRLAVSSSEALQYRRLWANEASQFSAASQGAGTIHEQAVIADFSHMGSALKVAIDADDAQAAMPNLLRFDFGGKGEFTDAAVVPLRFDDMTGRRSASAEILPATVEVMIDGQLTPVLIEGRYFYSAPPRIEGADLSIAGYRYLMLQVGTAATQLCEIDGALYEVTLLDGNANARLGDLAHGELVDGRMVNLDPGDTLLLRKVDATEEERARKAFYGVPVRIGENWYKISLAEFGDAISVEPASAPTGRVVLPSEGSLAMLAGTKGSVFVGYHEDGTPIPPDQYIIWTYWVPAKMDSSDGESAEAKSEEKRAWLHGGRSTADRGQARIIDVRSGEAVVLPMGTPLTVKATFALDRRDRNMINIGMDLRDVGGAEIDYIRLGNRLPPPPTLEIRSADGEIVRSATLEYG
jgi:hypothetical protein